MMPSEPSRASETNRAFYDRRSPGRDDYWRLMAAPRHRRRTLLAELVAEPVTSVVDLGCGDGSLLAEIGEWLPDAALAGVDLSAELVAANRRREPRMIWQVADLGLADSLPSGLHHRFDAALASEIIEHVTEPQHLLRNALACVVFGGRLLLSTQSGPVRETERRVGHVRHFSAAEMRDQLERAGWRPERIWNTGFPFHDLSKWYANRRPQATMERFAGAAYGKRERAVCWALRLLFRLNSQRRGAQLFAVARAP